MGHPVFNFHNSPGNALSFMGTILMRSSAKLLVDSYINTSVRVTGTISRFVLLNSIAASDFTRKKDRRQLFFGNMLNYSDCVLGDKKLVRRFFWLPTSHKILKLRTLAFLHWSVLASYCKIR